MAGTANNHYQRVILVGVDATTGAPVEVETIGGAVPVTTETERATAVEVALRTAICKSAGVCAVPDTDLSALTAADIIAWTFAAGKRNAKFAVTTPVTGAGAVNQIGWWVTINAGSTVAAKQRLQDALDSTQATKIAKVVAGATVDGDANKDSWIIGCGQEWDIGESDVDITDVYAYPVGEVSGAGLLGTSILTAQVS